VFLVTTTLTMAVLTIAGSVIYVKQADARARLEAQYARLSGHYAEEADLRVQSYRRAAGVIASVSAGRDSAEYGEKQLLEEAQKKSDAAAKVASTAEAKKATVFSAAVEAITRANAARADVEEAGKKLDVAKMDVTQASDELEQATGEVNRSIAAVGAAQVAVTSAVPAGDSGPVSASASAAQTTAAQVLQAERQKYATLVQKQHVAKARYDKASVALGAARAAADLAGQAETAAKQAEEDAIKPISPAEKATAVAAAKKDDARKFVEDSRKRIRNLRDSYDKVRPTFLPPPSDCEGSRNPRRCYAEAVASRLFSGPVHTLPRVVACPAAAPLADDSGVMLAGQSILFPIDDEAPSPGDGKAESREGSAARPAAAKPGPRAAKDAKPEASAADKKAAAPPAEERLCLRVPVSEIAPLAHGRGATDGSVENAPGELLLLDAATCRVLEWSQTDSETRPVVLPGCNEAMLPKLGSSAEPKKKEEGKAQGANLEIGGQTYRGFWQPLREQFRSVGADAKGKADRDEDSGAARSLIVVNLVRQDRLEQEVRGLSPLTFLALVTLAALSIFSWPIAKLWLVGASSRFNRFDSAFLGTSALAGTFIVTLVILALIGRERLNRRTDDQLGALASEITTRLDQAMKNASKNLGSFNDETKRLQSALAAAGSTQAHDFRIPDGVDKACRAVDKASRHVQWPFPEDENALWSVCETKILGQMTVGGPRASLAFWANEKGYVQIQESDTEHGPPPVNVAARDYFASAREACDRKGKPVDVPEVVRSLTSTQKVLVVARASCGSDPEAPKDLSVSGFETSLARFERLSVPPGLQWAVVDGSGRVMLHSSMDGHHLHDIFVDLDDSTKEEVRSAMFSRSTEPFRGEYRGIRSRLRVDQNTGTDWYIVTIASRTQNEAITRDTLVTTAATFGLFVLLMAFAAIAFVLSRLGEGKEHVLDPRPRAGAARTYAAVAARLAFGSTVLLLSTLVCPWIPTALLLLAAAALLVVSARQVPGIWPEEGKSSVAAADLDGWRARLRQRMNPLTALGIWDRLPATYALCCFCFAATFIVVPTTSLFVGAFSLASQSALRAEQRVVAEEPSCTGAAGPKCVKVVPGLEPVRGAPAPATETVSPYLSASALWPLEPLMAWFHPDYLQASANAASELRVAPGDPWGPRIASKDPDGIPLESVVPRLLRHTNWAHLGLGALGVVLLLLVAHAVAYLSLKRLFFMDTLMERSGSDKRTEPSGRVLFLFPPPKAIDTADESFSTTIVLRESDAWATPGPIIARVRAATRVLAEVDPLRRGPPESRAQWAEVLKDFKIVRGPGRPPQTSNGTPNPAAFTHQWNLSDLDERKVLAQLALDGHASPNPSNEPVLRHLAARGLVDDATLTIADPAFARYIESSITPEQMKEWQAGETEVAWDVIRLPLVTSVGLVLMLVFVSRPELAESGALLLPPAAGSLPAVLRFVAMLARGRGDAVAT